MSSRVPELPQPGGPRIRRVRRRRLHSAATPVEPPAPEPPAPGAPFRIARRAYWFGLAALLHLMALGTWLWLFPAAPEPERNAAIPVSLVPAEEPPEAEVPREILQFRQPTHPRVQEAPPLAREVLALAPPPVDLAPEPSGAPGGYSLELAAHSASGPAWGGAGGGTAFSGAGAGNARAPTGSFEKYVGGIRQIGLDVVFVIDATGSMGWLIADVKQRVRSLAEWIRELVPVTRFGVVAYRDEDDPEFLVRVEPLSLDVGRVFRFLDRLEARGGGDAPEGLHAGLEAAALRAGWKPDARRVIVVLADAPPHPEREAECLDVVRRFHAEGGSVSFVDVSFDANPEIVARQLGKLVDQLLLIERRGVMPEFAALAQAGGGDAATLQGETRVVRQLAVLIFGQRWADAVRPLLGDL